MAFNIKASGSYYAYLDDSLLSTNRYYTFPNENGTFVTNNSTNAIGTNQIINDAVTYDKIQNVTSQRLLGRASAGSGNTEEITLGSAFSFDGTTLNVSAGATVTNAVNNRLITSDGTSTGLVAESNIQFDANRLSVTGSVTASQYTGSNFGRNSPTFIGLASSASFTQVITSTITAANFSPPTWCQFINVICIGGGGGGGAGSPFHGTKWKTGGGGGAGGAISMNRYRRSELVFAGASLQVTVGGGGSGGTTQGTSVEIGYDGNPGGDSSFGTIDRSTSFDKIAPIYAYGGQGGQGGFTSSDTSNLRTRYAHGWGMGKYTLGSGAGGAGSVPVTAGSKDKYSTALGTNTTLFVSDAPHLPYTPNDLHKISAIKVFTTDTGLSQLGDYLNAPAEVTTTGGGGGLGASNVGDGVHRSVFGAGNTPLFGAGGRILRYNSNTGGRANISDALQTYTVAGAYGIFDPNTVQSNWLSPNSALIHFLPDIPIGIGGRSGYANGTAAGATLTAAQNGSDYGGGGGGGCWKQAGGNGGAGAVIIIYEG